MKKETTVHETHFGAYPFKRICWSAIFVGAVIALGLSFLLNLFGIAIGLSAVSMGPNGSVSLALGGMLGFVIAVIVSMIVSGYAAGYLGRLYAPKRNLGILYGFTTWSVALVLSAVMMGNISNYSHTAANSTLTLATNASTQAHDVTIKTSTDEQPSNNKVTTTSTHLAAGAFLIFALFFVGAIATCIGACWGMSRPRDDE